jgi:hypothetical protein
MVLLPLLQQHQLQAAAASSSRGQRMATTAAATMVQPLQSLLLQQQQQQQQQQQVQQVALVPREGRASPALSSLGWARMPQPMRRWRRAMRTTLPVTASEWCVRPNMHAWVWCSARAWAVRVSCGCGGKGGRAQMHGWTGRSRWFWDGGWFSVARKGSCRSGRQLW